MNYIWKEKTGQYQSGYNLYLNRIHLGGFEWNSSRTQSNRDPTIAWVGQVNLPSLKDPKVYGSTHEEVKDKMEKIVTQWFKEALAR